MKILLNGHKDSLNIGNMLMVLGLIKGLNKKCIHASLFLLSDLPEIDRERYKDIPNLTIIGRPWSKQKKGSLLTVSTAMLYGFWALVFQTLRRLFGDQLPLPKGQLWSVYTQADVAVEVSGDDLTTAYGCKAPLQVLYELSLAKIFGLKTLLLAQSLGPFDGRFMKICAHLLYSLADFVTLRDADSFLFWQQIISQKNGQNNTPDYPLADLIHLNEMERAAKEAEHGPIIINLSNYVVETSLRLGEETMGDVALHHYLCRWVDFLEYIRSYTGRELVLLAHTFRPGKGDDGYWLNILHNQCPAVLPIKEISGPLLPSEIQRIVGGSSFIIASRMHLALTAMKCGVPFLSIAYSHKYQQFNQPLHFKTPPVIFLNEHHPELLFDVIKQHFKTLWDERQSFQTSIQSYAVQSTRLAEENISFLTQLLKLKKEDH